MIFSLSPIVNIMAKYSTDKKTETPTDGQTIRHQGKDVGTIVFEKNQPVFDWGQHPLKIETNDKRTAYGMSVGLIDKLEVLGVKDVYINRSVMVSLRRIKAGKHLNHDDSRFNTAKAEDQKVIYI